MIKIQLKPGDFGLGPIKAIREYSGMGLFEAKQLWDKLRDVPGGRVESAPWLSIQIEEWFRRAIEEGRAAEPSDKVLEPYFNIRKDNE